MPATNAAYTTVVSSDPLTQETVAQTSPRRVGDGPGWLAALAEGDVMTYSVQTQDRDLVTVDLTVARLVRRGTGVAVLLSPTAAPGEVEVESHWLAGDDHGLYRLPRHEDLEDPGFVPLDAQGRVQADSRRGAKWRVPTSWPQEGSLEGEGWELEELELTLDGPVRGQRCARIRRQRGERVTRLTICADLGMVELSRGTEAHPSERWHLLRILRPETTAI